MEHLTINLNIHCEECEAKIHQIFAKHFVLVDLDKKQLIQDVSPGNDIYYRQEGNTVDLYHDSKASKPLIKSLIKSLNKSLRKAGFDVVSWDYYIDDNIELSSNDDMSPDLQRFEYPDLLLGIRTWLDERKNNRLKLRHIENCLKCQQELQYEKDIASTDSLDSSFGVVVDNQTKEYRAVILVGGMTCASCVQAVSDAIKSVLSVLHIDSKDEEPNYSVNLIQHLAVVIVPNKTIINDVSQAIYDAGFDVKVLEVLPVERSINVKVTAAISGITCAACANSITSSVNELKFVVDCNVNTVTKTGIFVMENSPDNIEKLKTTIEDCGFDFEVLNTTKINYALTKKQSRTIKLSISGMHCAHCPELIHDYLSSFGEAVVIEDDITLAEPYVKFTYIPHKQKKLTIRNIMNDLNHLRDGAHGYIVDYTTEGTFHCELVQGISMDEQLEKLSRAEVLKIVRRLIIATVFAIPTFIFGVVAMLLLPKKHKFRMWIEEPLWTGNVSRATWILLFLSTPVYFFAADVFHKKALAEIRSLWMHKNSFKKRLLKFGSMNLLMFLGTTVAYLSSIVLLILSSQQKPSEHHAFMTTYFDSVVFLTFFLLIGRLLESISKSKTANAIVGLSKLKSTKATLVDEVKKGDNATYTNDQTVDVFFLEVDDYIKIATGESPPVDCVIIDREAEFDESALTGESVPIRHTPGQQIFSGTVNVSNHAVVAKVLSLENDSLIDQIVNTVREGQLTKAPIERVADTLTGYFVPIIVLVGVLVFIIWLSLSYSGALPQSYLDLDIGGWAMWSLEFAIAVFVIACPCGIGLAAPTALFVGSGLAAKYGILVKGGGAAFQDGANTKIVCFDKTGTLTHGKFQLTDYAFVNSDVALKGVSLQLSRDLELASKHPIAQSIKEFVSNQTFNYFKLSSTKVPSVETIAGKGLYGEIVSTETNESIWNTLNGSVAILGNETLLKDYDLQLEEEQKEVLTKWKQERKSVVLLCLQSEAYFKDSNMHLLLMMACRDQIRNETVPVIDFLTNELKIECYMITGDNKITAEAVAKQLGIEPSHIFADVLPDDKQAAIKSIKSQKPDHIVAMVGDGINDGPALATADIGIALSSGADLAVTTSDFILLNAVHPLSSLVTLFDLSKKVFTRVKMNFAWALIYNCIGIPIAAGVIYPYKNSRLSPVWASAAMALSSVSVVLSSLALNWYKPLMKVQESVNESIFEPKETVFER